MGSMRLSLPVVAANLHTSGYIDSAARVTTAAFPIAQKKAAGASRRLVTSPFRRTPFGGSLETAASHAAARHASAQPMARALLTSTHPQAQASVRVR